MDTESALDAWRPVLESTAARMVASPSFGPIVQRTVAPIHRALMSGEQDQIVLRIDDVGAALASSLPAVPPQWAAALPVGLDVQLVVIDQQGRAAAILRFLRMAVLLAWALPVLGVVLLVGAGAMSGRAGHGGGVNMIARGVLAAAGVLMLLLIAAQITVMSADVHTIAGALRNAIWQELRGSFLTSTAFVAVAGLVLRLVSYRAQTRPRP